MNQRSIFDVLAEGEQVSTKDDSRVVGSEPAAKVVNDELGDQDDKSGLGESVGDLLPGDVGVEQQPGTSVVRGGGRSDRSSSQRGDEQSVGVGDRRTRGPAQPSSSSRTPSLFNQVPRIKPDKQSGTGVTRSGQLLGSSEHGTTQDDRQGPQSPELPTRPLDPDSVLASGAGSDQKPFGVERPVSADLSEFAPPATPARRAAANIAALEQLQHSPDPATDFVVLSKWSGWGAIPQVFDPRSNQPWATKTGDYLRDRLTPEQYQAARASTTNAHYTSPQVADAMWRTLQNLGFGDLANVWEPGAGIGVFAAAAPITTTVTGVELDPITAQIYSRLHPGHRINNADLARVEVDGLANAAIGNVPFSSAKIFDPEFSPHRNLSLHNYAIRKALAAVEPGGPVMVITSSYTLDAEFPGQRDILAAHGDFLGAVRLPSSTFAQQSGTEVTTDILLMRRNDKPVDFDRELAAGWRHVESMQIPGTRSMGKVNKWFIDNPDLVVGEWTQGTMTGRPHLAVSLPADELIPRLTTALAKLENIARPLLTEPVHKPSPTPASVATRVARPQHIKPGGLWKDPGGGVYQWDLDGQVKPFTASPKKDAFLLETAIELRDSYIALIDAENRSAADTEDRRATLNRSYNRFVAANNNKPVTYYETKDGKNGQRKVWPALGGFRRHDPDYAILAALDTYDADGGHVEKAPIFDSRQVTKQHEPQITNMHDAVAVSLAKTNRVDTSLIADLLEIPEESVPEQFDGAAFFDPEQATWVDRYTYLSGDVRAKRDVVAQIMQRNSENSTDHLTDTNMDLAAALEEYGIDQNTILTTTKSNHDYTENLLALSEVVPSELTIDQISVKLGVSWLRPDEIKAFVTETLGFNMPSLKIDYDPSAGFVTNIVKVGPDQSVAATQTWGTPRFNALKLIKAGLEQKPVTVWDYPDPDSSRRVLNKAETVLAGQKLEALNLALKDWIASDPERAAQIADRYNKLFQSFVKRSNEDAPTRVPGLVDHIELRPHQARAVQRAVTTRRLGLYHEVGAGKTYVMATTAMEWRRLGIANKPLMVVPAHLVTQIGTEWQTAFPAAKLLIQTGNTKADRMRLASQAAAGDWDGIIISQETYNAIPVSPEAESQYLENRVKVYDEAIANLSSHTNESTVKKIENQRAAAKERLLELLTGKTDDSFPLEAWNIDALLVDEVHDYKNLDLVSSRSDLTYAKSMRAARYDMKLNILRDQHPDLPYVQATGTPVSNGFQELWVMMRYSSPELLNKVGLGRFDAFATQFGDLTSDYELTAAGGFKLIARFASFHNVPELQALFSQHGDVQRAEDLNLPRPVLEGGKRHYLTIPKSPQLADYMAELSDRTNKLPNTDPTEDNHLAIISDARLAAISLRLVGKQDHPTNKITVLAEAIAERYHNEKNNTYLDKTGNPHPIPGSLQIVFLDRGTPNSKVADLYSWLSRELADRGVPNDKIAAVHHHDKDRAGLFRAAREGKINVLLGSTGKMGTGMNVQTRASALWHVDIPYKPAEFEQRDGRILRQGNQHPAVHIGYLVTEGSADAYSYQTVERKAKMIKQVLTNQNTARTVESIDSDDLDFATLKALSTGDPNVLELLRAKRTYGEIQIAAEAHTRRLQAAEKRLAASDRQIPQLETAIAFAETAHATFDPKQIGQTDEELRQIIRHNFYTRGTFKIATIGDVTFYGTTTPDRIVLEIGDNDNVRFPASPILNQKLRTARVKERLINAVTNLPTQKQDTQDKLTMWRNDRQEAIKLIGQPEFPRTDELNKAKTKVDELEELVTNYREELQQATQTQKTPNKQPPTDPNKPATKPPKTRTRGL